MLTSGAVSPIRLYVPHPPLPHESRVRNMVIIYWYVRFLEASSIMWSLHSLIKQRNQCLNANWWLIVITLPPSCFFSPTDMSTLGGRCSTLHSNWPVYTFMASPVGSHLLRMACANGLDCPEALFTSHTAKMWRKWWPSYFQENLSPVSPPPFSFWAWDSFTHSWWLACESRQSQT